MPPTFLCIGAQKAGTTWLYVLLDKHPDISFGPGDSGSGLRRKERHFWCRHLHDRPIPDDDSTRRYRAAYPATGASGDMTPHYGLLDDESVGRISVCLPEARILYLLRDPRLRAWSNAWAWLTKQDRAPGELNLPHRWADGDKGDADLDLDAVIDALSTPATRAQGEYAPVIRRWRDHFGGALLLLRTDDIAREPRDLIARCYRHLGVDAELAATLDDHDLEAWVNPHRPAPPSVPERVRAVLDETFAKAIADTATETGWDVSSWQTW